MRGFRPVATKTVFRVFHLQQIQGDPNLVQRVMFDPEAAAGNDLLAYQTAAASEYLYVSATFDLATDAIDTPEAATEQQTSAS